ncbi:MAG: hypothetical protein IJX28_03680 [Clostridia bacterium]|nr:hypothetical protein [Clostridia bacterium]
MIFHLILEVAVAMFAAFGFYCALRAMLDLLFAPKQITVAIEVQDKEDAEMLDVLLHEASSAFFRQGRRARIRVLISAALLDGVVGEDGALYEKYLDWLQMYGATWHAVELIQTED